MEPVTEARSNGPSKEPTRGEGKIEKKAQRCGYAVLYDRSGGGRCVCVRGLGQVEGVCVVFHIKGPNIQVEGSACMPVTTAQCARVVCAPPV